MYKKISDYGIIGNLHTVALIAKDSSIDWMCLPYLDSPGVFNALLDDRKGGCFSITPAETYDSVAEYIEDTNVLKTGFRTSSAEAEITDFMPVCLCSDGSSTRHKGELYRKLEVLKGEMTFRLTFTPAFNYARDKSMYKIHPQGIQAYTGKETLTLALSSPVKFDEETGSAEIVLKKGTPLWFRLRYDEPVPSAIEADEAEAALKDTIQYWHNWLNQSETGRRIEPGPYRSMLNRSALLLKLLYYEPTGTIAAAATTSLPESLGGERNWDYRYTWLRDASLTLQALFNLGHMSETEGFIRWIESLLSEKDVSEMQIMYGLRGEHEIEEIELTHLEGYRGSRPVRVGNAASTQSQLDIYGELMDAVMKLSSYVGKINTELWPFLRSICNHVCEHWKQRDYGIWEVRGGPYHFVHSKVMCWVALDRGIRIARMYGFSADLKRWQKEMEEIRKEVFSRGWNDKKSAFVQHYETDALDSSALLFPFYGFVDFNDPRMLSTVRAIERELMQDGFIYRYRTEDGLSGEEGTFLLCTFWLIDNYIGQGRIEEAERMICQIEKAANHLGLFSEMYDVKWKEALGNFPQAFTHIGYINSVVSLLSKKNMHIKKETSKKSKSLPKKLILNQGEVTGSGVSEEVVSELKETMNILRGAFFDTRNGRVAYERMKNSEVYLEYVEKSRLLQGLALESLTTEEEKKAFWINIYNLLVIHGVIELDIRDSVKEVKDFFKRIYYRIGGVDFCPEDIEHGILRLNRRPPHSLFRVFSKNDPRLKYTLKDFDPRVHFALVCASSSCPPIDIYTPEEIDRQLDISAKTFLNGGGVTIDKEKAVVWLSMIFRWYEKDFGKSTLDILHFIAPYLYNEEDRKYTLDNAHTLKIRFQDYDWRLNRY